MLSLPLRRAVASVAVSLLVLFPAATHVRADVITIDFNSLPAGASNSAVQQYLQAALTQQGYHGTVTVSGALGEKGYTGDGHVVGPNINGRIVPMTLGTTDAGVLHSGLDAFVVNRPGSDRVVIQLSQPIFGVGFDYEIFPNGDVPNGNIPGVEFPDFTFLADGTTVFHTVGVMPGEVGALSGFPASPAMNPELAPQFLGMSGFMSFPNGVSRLEFVDWPVRVGIDNLQLDPSITQVPEPGTVFVLGVTMAGLLLVHRIRRGRPPPLAMA